MVFRKVLKWGTIVLANIIGLFLVLRIGFLGEYLGWVIAYAITAGIQLILTNWLSNSLVYSRFGSAHRTGLKLVYIFIILPAITAIASATVAHGCATIAHGYTNILTTTIQDWSTTEWWIALIIFSLWFIPSYIFGVNAVFDKKELAEVAISFEEKGRLEFQNNNLEKAKCYCEKALHIWETLPEDLYPEKANIHATLGSIHLKEWQYEAAREDYEKELSIKRAKLGDNHYVIASYYTLIAKTYEEDLDFNNEIKYRRKALETLINSYGENNEKVADAYFELSRPLQLWGYETEAIDCLEHALSIRQTLLGPNSLDLLNLYVSIQVIYLVTKDYVKSREYAEKELLIKQMNYDEDNPEIAESFTSIAYTYFMEENYSKATEYYEKARSVRERSLGESHDSVASTSDMIGAVQLAQGKYREALDSFLNAYHIRTKANNQDKSNLASSFYNLGIMYHLLGDYNKAHFYAESGRAIVLSMEDKDYSFLANCIDLEGLSLLDKGEYDKALARHEEALKIRQEHLPDNYDGLSTSFIAIGSVLHNLKEYVASLEYYLKALPLIESSEENRYFNSSLCYIDIADTYSAMGNFEESINALHKAKDFLKNTKNNSYPLNVEILSSLGKYYYKRQEYMTSIKYFNKAIIDWRPFYGQRHPNIGLAHYYIGKAYLKIGDNDLALEHLNLAQNIQKDFLNPNHPDYLATLEVISHINNHL